ncbi:hypothetical protein CEK62_03065 [Alcanivorax sp. N3-2A]|nr:hypothetical protein CEK62_03065 [Alcanivorax sp. N3-2A]
MTRSFAPLALNFVGFQLLWFVAVYGGAQGWGDAALAVLVVMQAGVWALGRPWRRDLPLLCAGAFACIVLEPVWMVPGLIHYQGWSYSWLAPGWIWALWLGFAVSFNYCLAWLCGRPLLAALFGGIGGVISVTVGIRLGAATTPQGWLPLALSYAAIWALVVPALALLAQRVNRSAARV